MSLFSFQIDHLNHFILFKIIHDRIWIVCPFGRFACSVFHLNFHPNSVYSYNPANISIFEIIRKIPSLMNIGENFGAFQIQPGASSLPFSITQDIFMEEGERKRSLAFRLFLWSRSLFDPRSIATYISRLQRIRATCTPTSDTATIARQRERVVIHSPTGGVFNIPNSVNIAIELPHFSMNMVGFPLLSSWWLNQPIWKIYIYSQIGSFPQVGVKIKNV